MVRSDSNIDSYIPQYELVQESLVRKINYLVLGQTPPTVQSSDCQSIDDESYFQKRNFKTDCIGNDQSDTLFGLTRKKFRKKCTDKVMTFFSVNWIINY